MKVVYEESNVRYIPQPNMVEVVLSDELAPFDLAKTAFVLPFFENGDVLLANNLRRGLEVPGGHIEEGEDFEMAAIREAIEEVGCEVIDLVPIGYLRMTSFGDAPPDYRYPHPLGYQQFFAARIAARVPCGDYECGEPVRTSSFHGLRPSIAIFAQRGREILCL